MNEWLRFKDAGQRAIDAGIAWQLRMESDYNPDEIRLAYSVCDETRRELSFTSVKGFNAAAGFLYELVNKVRKFPDNAHLLEYRLEDAPDFNGRNTYWGTWEFPNGYGVSVCRKGSLTYGTWDFHVLIFKGWHYDEILDKTVPTWLEHEETPDSLFYIHESRYSPDEIDAVLVRVVNLEVQND